MHPNQVCKFHPYLVHEICPKYLSKQLGWRTEIQIPPFSPCRIPNRPQGSSINNDLHGPGQEAFLTRLLLSLRFYKRGEKLRAQDQMALSSYDRYSNIIRAVFRRLPRRAAKISFWWLESEWKTWPDTRSHLQPQCSRAPWCEPSPCFWGRQYCGTMLSMDLFTLGCAQFYVR